MELGQNVLYFLLGGSGALFALGVILSILARPKGEENAIVERLEKALPSAQCAQCGFPGCRAYAEALANNSAACNLCPPGGTETTEHLAEILGISVPVDENEDAIFTPRTVAFIHESACTGCTKCTRYCPVDAISGTIRNPHVVLNEECIGCNDCVKTCPEGCIEMIRLEPTLANFNWELNSIRFKGGNN